ncbi:unnamed protein product [Cochlearia groenlandica]
MGCCFSLASMEDLQEEAASLCVDGSSLTKFSLYDLKMATNNFSSRNIVSETGFGAYDIVYKGGLGSHGFVAIKRFMNMAWPDPNQFVEDVKKMGKIRHKRVVYLIGYCCDGEERLIVARLMSNDTLAKQLFHWESKTMEWPMRMRVAYCVAEALDYCMTTCYGSYHNLSAYTVLFNEDGDACLSCFGLMKKINGERRTNGSVKPESVIYRFGTVLLNLLSGKQIPPSHAPDFINGKNVIDLMDPNLERNFSLREATAVFELASQCLEYEDRENLSTKELVATLESLQTMTQVPCYGMVEMTKHKEVSWTRVSPLEEACSKMDLTAIHSILVMSKYEDDKEVIELSFEEWTQDMKDLQEVRKRGDQAFIDKDFKTAIDCYSQFIEGRRNVYPSVYARRSLCYLYCNHPDRALLDGIYAQAVFPDWPTAYYLQSVALAELNMSNDSANILKEATLLEAKRLGNEKEKES